MPADLIVNFVRERETKNKIMFREEPDLKVVGRLYMDKNVYARIGSPATLEVEIKPGKES